MPCVLIVEDDPDLREYLELLLALSGYETMSASNGQDALQQMHMRKPCAVLLDMHMPVMDGWEFRRRQMLDPEQSNVPVIAVTAHFDPREVERRLGITCLSKPVSEDRMLGEVEHVCGHA